MDRECLTSSINGTIWHTELRETFKCTSLAKTRQNGCIRRSGQNSRVWAEIGELQPYPGGGFSGPCVIIAQGGKDILLSTVLVKVEDDKIKRIDMWVIPPPDTAKRTGEYPA